MIPWKKVKGRNLLSTSRFLLSVIVTTASTLVWIFNDDVEVLFDLDVLKLLRRAPSLHVWKKLSRCGASNIPFSASSYFLYGILNTADN